MTATQQFIEDAIAGGWQEGKVESRHEGYVIVKKKDYYTDLCTHSTLLDPLAWQAVGKTRGWYVAEGWINEGKSTHLRHWKAFIDWLDQGKTIEEALSLI